MAVPLEITATRLAQAWYTGGECRIARNRFHRRATPANRAKLRSRWWPSRRHDLDLTGRMALGRKAPCAQKNSLCSSSPDSAVSSLKAAITGKSKSDRGKLRSGASRIASWPATAYSWPQPLPR